LNPKIAELEDGVAESVTHRAGQQGSGGRAPEARAPAARPQPLPAHLPRKRVVIEPPAAACSSCGCTVLRKIGKVVTELLEYLPSSFKVIQHVRPTMSCRTCKTRLQVPLPSLPIEGGRPGAALLAQCLLAHIIPRLTALWQASSGGRLSQTPTALPAHTAPPTRNGSLRDPPKHGKRL